MKSSAIRHLVASRSSSRIAAALFEKTVQIWDLQKREQISEFETVLSFGGRRVELHPSGELCFAASWEKGRRGGVACYNALTGEVVWHRTDLRQTQILHFSAAANAVWCIPEKSSTKGLDASTGETLVEMRGLSDLFESPYSPYMLLLPRKRDYILRGREEFRLPRLSFAVGDVVFTRDAVYISEVRGPVRCFELSTGAEGWRNEEQWGRLWCREADNQIYGVHCVHRGGIDFNSLALLDALSGACVDICELSPGEEDYCSTLDCVVTSNGEMISINDGTLLHKLPFPEMEYPDKVSNRR